MFSLIIHYINYFPVWQIYANEVDLYKRILASKDFAPKFIEGGGRHGTSAIIDYPECISSENLMTIYTGMIKLKENASIGRYELHSYIALQRLGWCVLVL